MHTGAERIGHTVGQVHTNRRLSYGTTYKHKKVVAFILGITPTRYTEPEMNSVIEEFINCTLTLLQII